MLGKRFAGYFSTPPHSEYFCLDAAACAALGSLTEVVRFSPLGVGLWYGMDVLPEISCTHKLLGGGTSYIPSGDCLM